MGWPHAKEKVRGDGETLIVLCRPLQNDALTSPLSSVNGGADKAAPSKVWLGDIYLLPVAAAKSEDFRRDVFPSSNNFLPSRLVT